MKIRQHERRTKTAGIKFVRSGARYMLHDQKQK